MKATKVKIDEFLAQPRIAVAGYSKNPKKFGFMVYKALQEKGFNLFPVNPSGGITPDGDPIYNSIDELPADVKALLVLTKPEVSVELVQQALLRGFTHFWIQQMSENNQVLEALEKAPCKVTGQCIILHANPSGFHKIHLWIAKMFGMMPA
jgi:uncharacterized protein